MTFNPDADISGNTTRRRGRGTAIAAGGGVGVLGIVALLVAMFGGPDLTGLIGGAPGGDQQPSSSDTNTLSECKTGTDANADASCRMAGAELMLNDYWSQHVDGYQKPSLTMVNGQTQTQCGTASNAVGPFYCPPEQGVYLDPTFFQLMQQQFGASAGDLAQLYIVGHEWGHHIQNITGTMDEHPNNGTGPDSNSVRTELQADCYAGAWLKDAVKLKDENGNNYLEPYTDAQLKDAVNAAYTVGDDHIQEQSGFVNPESFTHGTSEQRQGWFANGYKNGLGVCDTFAAGVKL